MINYLIIIELLITYIFSFSSGQYLRHLLSLETDIWTWKWTSDLAIKGIFDLLMNQLNRLIVHFSMIYLILKRLQVRMKQWWFWYAISKLIKKLIILRLFFIYFNYAINQLINQLLHTAPSESRLHVLHGGISGCRRRPGNVASWRIEENNYLTRLCTCVIGINSEPKSW